jgi:hypothetical protein
MAGYKLEYKRRIWTEREINFLYDHAGEYSIAELAVKLNRTCSSVRQFRRKHHMPKAWDNVYTYTILARELNRCRKVLWKWVQRGWLVGRWSTNSFLYGKKAMLFAYEDIISFLNNHYRLFVDRMPENLFFKNIVKEQLANDNG